MTKNGLERVIKMPPVIHEYKNYQGNPFLEWAIENKLLLQAAACLLLILVCGISIGARWFC
jgi:hypothetical protein